MSRNRASAKAAGTRFETAVARHLAAHYDDRIERRARSGALDRGDIANVRTRDGRRVVLECKDTSKIDLAGWMRELEAEIENDEALTGAVVHKRHGVGDPGSQWVTLNLDQFIWLLKGER